MQKASLKSKVRVGHRLRSYDRTMPEEMNRILVDHCSDYLFAPTEISKNLLLKEGIEPGKIFLTGNTVVDAVFKNIRLAKKHKSILHDLNLNHKAAMLRLRLRHVDFLTSSPGWLFGFPVHPGAGGASANAERSYRCR